MVDDLALNLKAATFGRGSRGTQRHPETSRIPLREGIGQLPVIMPFATAFIQEEKKGLLLKKQGIGKEWGFPSVRMELGERIDQTLVRRILQETGWRLEVKKLIGIYSNDEGAHDRGDVEKIRVLHILFQCQIFEESRDIKDIPSDQFQFFPPEAKPPLSQFHGRFFRDGLADREEAIFGQ